MTPNNQDKMAESMSREKFHSTWKTSALDHCKVAQGDERIPLVALLLPLVFLPGSPAQSLVESLVGAENRLEKYTANQPQTQTGPSKIYAQVEFQLICCWSERAHNAVVSLEREEPECVNGSKVTDGLTKMGMHVHVWRD